MMYHPYTQSIINDLAAGHVEMGFAVEIMAPSAPVRVHTGVGQVVINGVLYLGLCKSRLPCLPMELTGK